MLAPDAEVHGLTALPEAISWRLFQPLDNSHYRVDFVCDGGTINEFVAPDWTTPPENFGLPIDFEMRDVALSRAYRALLKEKYGNAASRPTALFALMLSRAVKARVLCVNANDDGVDATVTVTNDSLERWTFSGNGEVISIEADGTIRRKPVDKEIDGLLHGLAMRDVKNWLGRVPSFMGTFDPEPECQPYRLIDRHVGTDLSVIRARRKAKAQWNAENPNPKKLESWGRRQAAYRQGQSYDYRQESLDEPLVTRMKRWLGL